MPTSAAPAHGCPVSWHHCRGSSGVQAKTESTPGCSGLSGFALCLHGHCIRLGTLLAGDLLASIRLQPAAILAGLSLTVLRTSFLFLPTSSPAIWEQILFVVDPSGRFLVSGSSLSDLVGAVGFLINSSYFRVFISAGALPQVPPEQPSNMPG